MKKSVPLSEQSTIRVRTEDKNRIEQLFDGVIHRVAVSKLIDHYIQTTVNQKSA